MKVVVNGEPREVEPPPGVSHVSVDDLLRMLGVPRERVAVERNGDIVLKAERATQVLQDGDVLEVVTLVGGG